ncbi:Utp21 specific WD40 associated putative domain-containing protein [Jimgerdemannia flammicorona]|uniref:Utp21 specific WD40 associated putative domain-containing protein n=1 Tax=Jimgerdemannia flammicorona TaxID=994334 RepID=A0A433QMQ8_9FUNG|nr:Utp21 specific WD40 associated putative domain-containing protein [Jimgerdemannia flammicorona]
MVAEHTDAPSKRAKVQATPQQPRIFQPYRAIGYVTNDLPFVIHSKGQQYFLTTCVGLNYQIYNVAKMNLLFVGPQTKKPITAIASSGNLTFTACGNDVIVFKRSKEVDQFDENACLVLPLIFAPLHLCTFAPTTKVSRITNQDPYTIFHLTVFGSHVIALCDDNTLKMWNYTTGELYTELEFDESFTVSTLLHPSTYLNKVLIGSLQGVMQIWNVRTSTLVYTFNSVGSPITSLMQSPVVDVVAIGLLDGNIQIHNIKVDQVIMTVKQEDRVTATSFRTDGQHIMASANMHGDIALWDLDKRKLVHVMKGAHDGLIPSIQFLNGQPILISSGADNSVKQWLFDSLDGLPRLLKWRGGHHAPPHKIRYYGDDGRFILSTARDRSMRAFSTVRDSQRSLSKKSKLLNLKVDDLKLPQVTYFSASKAKQKDWDNILTCHLNETAARTWSYQRKALGKHVLASKDQSQIKVVAISTCGNFGIIGSAAGGIDMFNMQSGLHRHTKAVTGLATDNLNRTLISGSIDATIRIWDFQSARLIHSIQLPSSVTSIIFQHESDLLGVASDDLCIRIIDVETQKIVREFWGHMNRVTDMTFSPDGRWIISSSLDSTIRTWDLPSGNLVDSFKVDSVATSVTFSPTGDFLATAHVDNVGICLWANRTQFENVSLRSIGDDEIASVKLPTASGMGDEEADAYHHLAHQTPDDGEVTDLLGTSEISEQLTEKMITLSLLPRSKWQNLLSLDTIKKRNKPKEAPKAPEKAPFFLPTLPGVDPKFVAAENAVNFAQSKIVQLGALRPQTEFKNLLKESHEKRDYTAFFNYLESLNPSAIDFEIRSMSLEDDLSELQYFLEALESQLKTRRKFELVQAYLNVFLNVHGDLIVANPGSLQPRLEAILQTHRHEFERLSEQIHYGLCLIGFARNG